MLKAFSRFVSLAWCIVRATLLIAVVCALPYLIGVFVAWDFNPGNWYWVLRAAVASLYAAVLWFFASLLLPDASTGAVERANQALEDI